jgi:hypothetical protein
LGSPWADLTAHDGALTDENHQDHLRLAYR